MDFVYVAKELKLGKCFCIVHLSRRVPLKVWERPQLLFKLENKISKITKEAN